MEKSLSYYNTSLLKNRKNYLFIGINIFFIRKSKL